MTTLDHITQWCKENDVALLVRSQYHYTLTHRGRRIDIYSGKKMTYHDVTGKTRGDILTPQYIIEFLYEWLEGRVKFKDEPNKDELLATYVNNRFGTSLTPQHAQEIAKYIHNHYK